MKQITKSRNPIQIRLDETLVTQINQFAKTKKLDFSKAVREILARGLGTIKPSATDPKFIKAHIELKQEVEEILRYLTNSLNNPATLLFYAEMFVYYLQEFKHPKIILDDYRALERWYRKRDLRKAKLEEKRKTGAWKKGYESKIN